jgi:hypothetical protein
MLCPITKEQIKSNDHFVFKTQSGCEKHYSREAIKQYIDTRGDFRDPLTREPYTSTTLRNGGISTRSRVVRKLSVFWRKHVTQNVERELLSNLATMALLIPDTGSLYTMLSKTVFITGTQMLLLNRARFRRIRRMAIETARDELSAMSTTFLFDQVEESFGKGDFDMKLEFDGRVCTLLMVRNDGTESSETKGFPKVVWESSADFGRWVAQYNMLPEVRGHRTL